MSLLVSFSFPYNFSLIVIQSKLYSFIKWGSFPVVNVNNATYPPQIHLENNTIQVTAVTVFAPKSVTIVPVYSPEPGDWFVAAYLSSWDENVHQKVGYLFCFFTQAFLITDNQMLQCFCRA